MPIELKTGKAPMQGVWPGHKIQVAVYQLLLESEMGMEVTEGYVRYLDYYQDRPVMLNVLLRKQVFALRDKILIMLDAAEAPEPCTKSMCACEELAPA